MNVRTIALAGISAISLNAPAFAQEAPQERVYVADDGIVVTARRRDEDRQDVPLVVQAVTAQELQKLNIREFKDIQSLVPGLTMAADPNGIGNRTTLRGVAYDVNASGNNGTIEFYFNESPISAGILFQSMFDVGQIEVLRGPQGTLRGRASPSGSITVTSKKAILNEVGINATTTVNSWGEFNVQAALNLPIISDVLAVRVAGIVDDSDDNRVRSINFDSKPTRKTHGGRISLRFDPIDNLTINASATQTIRTASNFLQVESVNIANPALPASPVLIGADDLESVLRVPNAYRQNFKVFNWSAQYSFLGQKFDYAGSLNKQRYHAFDPNDKGAALPNTAPLTFLQAAQITDVDAQQSNHEFRLSSDERVFGIFDYVVGALFNKLDNPTFIDVQTPVFIGTTASPAILNHTPVLRGGGSRERSFFGNITAHIGEDSEISGGIRRIRYHSLGSLTQNGTPVLVANDDRVFHATIFSASAKHNFTRNVMVYGNFGTSWRPGSSTNSIQTRGNPNITGVLADLLFPPPEKSKSYELGVKTTWLDGRLRLNADVFHQTFKNFQYSASQILYLTQTTNSQGTTVPGVGIITTLATGVPAKVKGIEAEIGFKPNRSWDISATLAYSKGKISNATVPCNNFGGVVPTVTQFLAATGGEQVATCPVSGLRSGTGSPFVATVQSEYAVPISNSLDGYVRGLANYYSKSLNNAINIYDNIPAYALANFYAGVRQPDGGWEIGGYVKNAFNVRRVTLRNDSSAPSGANVAGGAAPVSSYRLINTNLPREIGITARFALGSR